MDVFFGFGCNICYKTDDGSLKDISEENMKHVKDTLITFVGHADIIKHNEIYLCQLCCKELIRFDKFREKCFSHLIIFRQQCFNILPKLELEDDKAAANNTLKTFVYEENSYPASISTVCNEVLKSTEELNKSDLVQVINIQSQRIAGELIGDCSTASVLNNVIKCDESPVAFTNEEDMKNVIRCSEDIKLETFDVSNVSNNSQLQFIKEEIDLKDEIENSGSENFTLRSFENKSDEQPNLDVKVPVVNNRSDSTKEELHVKQENSNSEGAILERTEDEFGDGVHVTFEIANVRTIVNMEDGGKENIRNQEGKLGMKLRSRRRNKRSITGIMNAKPSRPYVRPNRDSQPHTCAVCNKTFIASSSLTIHARTHSGDRPYKCTVCNKSFTASSNLTIHERIHSGVRPYKCTWCNKSFTTSTNFIRHERIHSGDRPYKCTVCNKSFTRSSYLIDHQRIHSGIRPYKCTRCNKTFITSSSLTRHERIHSGDRPYKCTVCNKSFTRSSYLIDHQRIHSGIRPYKCSRCNKAFTALSNLIRHERIHSGVRPYKCTVCNKTFTQSGSLTKHERIHSGDRPYKCTLCNKTFTASFSLIIHKRKHSDVKP